MQDKDKNLLMMNNVRSVDANYYAKETYDYYKSFRESYDNQGSPIISIAHVNNFKVKITETMQLGLVIK